MSYTRYCCYVFVKKWPRIECCPVYVNYVAMFLSTDINRQQSQRFLLFLLVYIIYIIGLKIISSKTVVKNHLSQPKMTNQHQQQTQIRPTVHNQPFAIQPPQITGMIQSVFIRQNASSVKVSHQIANRRVNARHCRFSAGSTDASHDNKSKQAFTIASVAPNL